MIAAHFDDILDKSYISCQIGQYTINKRTSALRRICPQQSHKQRIIACLIYRVCKKLIIYRFVLNVIAMAATPTRFVNGNFWLKNPGFWFPLRVVAKWNNEFSLLYISLVASRSLLHLNCLSTLLVNTWWSFKCHRFKFYPWQDLKAFTLR